MFLTLLVFTFYSSLSRADNLCDAECTIVIDFPTGGSIEAIADLTITFGDNGLVDTATTSTAYVKGEQLLLNAGESLVFGNAGRFDIGDAGNIDYTKLGITSEGNITITVIGGQKLIYIPADGELNLSVGVLTIDGLILGGGTLNLGRDLLINSLNNGDTSGSLENTSGATLSIGNSVNLSSSTNGFITTGNNVLIDPSLMITPVNNTSNIITGEGTLVLNSTSNIISGEGTLVLNSTDDKAEKSGSGSLDMNMLFIFLVLLSLINKRLIRVFMTKVFS